MKKLAIKSLVSLISMVTILTGCGGNSNEAQTGGNNVTKPMVLKYAHPNAPDTVVGRYASGLAELVEQRTEGRIKIEVYPNSELGTHKEMIEGVKMGSIEMGQNDFAAIATLFPDLGLFNVPYLYRDAEHAAKAMNPNSSEVLKQMNENLIKEMNMRILGSVYYGYRQLTSNQPIHHPDDLSGQKIRANAYPVSMALVEGMKAIPTPVDFTELPTALATNVVTGQENPLTTILNAHIYETQKYVMMTNHVLAFLAVHINENVWNKIAPEDQKVIEEAIAEMTEKSIQEGMAEEETNLEQLKKNGMEVINEKEGLDRNAFEQSVTDKINEKFPEWKEMIEKIKSL